MVRSDLAVSGVIFTLDTESGFDQVVFITSSYGLGETIVQGQVNPDEFYVYKRALKAGKKSILRRGLGSKVVKMVYADSADTGQSVKKVSVPETDRRRFSITDAEERGIMRWPRGPFRQPMVSGGQDGLDASYTCAGAAGDLGGEKLDTLRRYRLRERSEVLTTGRSIGQRIGSGPVRIVKSAAEMDRVRDGDVLVTDMTDPDWEPVMKRAGAIVTNRGGRTCHAAIIARELASRRSSAVATQPGVERRQGRERVLREGETICIRGGPRNGSHVVRSQPRRGQITMKWAIGARVDSAMARGVGLARLESSSRACRVDPGPSSLTGPFRDSKVGSRNSADTGS